MAKKPARRRVRLLQLRPPLCAPGCRRENDLSFWQSRYALMRLADVESVPDRAAVVVVASAHRGEQFKSDLAEVRGADFAKTTGIRVVSINSWGRQDQLVGLRVPVVLAHCFRMHAPLHLLQAVANLALGCNRAHLTKRR